jgi:hypothetical protein
MPSRMHINTVLRRTIAVCRSLTQPLFRASATRPRPRFLRHGKGRKHSILA